MTEDWRALARMTLDGSQNGTMSFGEIVGMLTDAGIDGYAVDFRRSACCYYRPDGEALELEMAAPHASVAARFDVAVVREAIREAQTNAPGYSYRGFCTKVAAAGCAGYLVSLLGRRVLYFGRTGETHTEFFPGAGPADRP